MLLFSEKILNNFSASLLSELDSLEQEVKDAKRDEDKIKVSHLTISAIRLTILYGYRNVRLVL